MVAPKLRQTRARMMYMMALKLERAGADRYIRARDIAAIAGFGSRKSVTQVMRTLRAHGLVTCVGGCGPGGALAYKITPQGLVWLGDFPDRKENPNQEKENSEC